MERSEPFSAASPAATALRLQAEAFLQKDPLNTPTRAAPSTIDPQRLVHELQVHQVELEMQNQELRESRAAMETATARYTDFYDFSPAGFVSLARNASIVQINLAGALLLGSERMALTGKGFSQFVAAPDKAVFTALLQRVFATPIKQTCEIGLVPAQAHAASMGVNEASTIVQIDAIRSADGQECRAVVVDVSARKLAEQALMDANRELARSNADLEQFAYAASHDLIEPLRSVTSAVQLLQKRYEDRLDARADEFIAHAVCGCQRMLALIADLLAFSRLGARALPHASVAMDTALAAACDNLEIGIGESQAHIVHGPLPTVLAEASQMTQLFQNLIGNAIKFRGAKSAMVQVAARKEGRDWVFSVADQGIGIALQHHERIFDLFKRLHTREEYGGTGVGLALCKKIVERHGGRIWVVSELGQGTTVFFTLPVRA